MQRPSLTSLFRCMIYPSQSSTSILCRSMSLNYFWSATCLGNSYKWLNQLQCPAQSVVSNFLLLWKEIFKQQINSAFSASRQHRVSYSKSRKSLSLKSCDSFYYLFEIRWQSYSYLFCSIFKFEYIELVTHWKVSSKFNSNMDGQLLDRNLIFGKQFPKASFNGPHANDIWLQIRLIFRH